MGAVNTHVAEVMRGEIVESDYPQCSTGEGVWMARCLCGWSAVRRSEFDIRDELTRHRDRKMYEDARNYPARQVINGAAGLHYLVTLGGVVTAPEWVCCCGQRAYSTTEWDAHVKAVTR